MTPATFFPAPIPCERFRLSKAKRGPGLHYACNRCRRFAMKSAEPCVFNSLVSRVSTNGGGDD